MQKKLYIIFFYYYPKMESKQSLCPDRGWCFYEATSMSANIVESTYLFCLIVLSIFIFKYLARIQRYRQDNRYKQLFADSFLHVYHLIIAWLTCSITKVIINISVYLIYKDHESVTQPQTNSGIVIFSVVFLLLDFAITFFVLNLILIIPCHWLNIVLLSVNQSKDIDLETRKKISTCFFILKILNGYIKFVRPTFLVFLLTQPFILYLQQSDVGCRLPKINTWIVTIEAILIFVFYIFAYCVAEYTSKKKLIKMKKQDYLRLKSEYRFLISVLVIRVILNTVFRISTFIQTDLDSNCIDKNSQSRVRTTIFLSLGHTFMHLLPIIVILYIYRPNIEVRQRDQTILIHSDSQDMRSASDQEAASNQLPSSQLQINKTMKIKRQIQQKAFPKQAKE